MTPMSLFLNLALLRTIMYKMQKNLYVYTNVQCNDLIWGEGDLNEDLT
jgi:hypothetical protein